MEYDMELQMFLPRVTFEAIPIKELVADQKYQRKLSEHHVHRAVECFDIYQINPVKVSRRDGKNYVFNGQHTVEIVALASGSRDTPVWCMVYDDLVYHHEADIFANQQKFVKPLTPYEIFMANIEAGNEKQLLIKKLVEHYHIEISPLPKQSCTCAVGALEYIYDYFGYDILERTLKLDICAWEGSSHSLRASMLKGIAKILFVYDTDIKDELFIEKLSSVSEKEIIRNARERGGGMIGFAESILMVYNKKLHNPLPIGKLHKRKSNRKHTSNGENP